MLNVGGSVINFPAFFALVFFSVSVFCTVPVIFWSAWVIGHGKMCGKIKASVKNYKVMNFLLGCDRN